MFQNFDKVGAGSGKIEMMSDNVDVGKVASTDVAMETSVVLVEIGAGSVLTATISAVFADTAESAVFCRFEIIGDNWTVFEFRGDLFQIGVIIFIGHDEVPHFLSLCTKKDDTLVNVVYIYEIPKNKLEKTSRLLYNIRSQPKD